MAIFRDIKFNTGTCNDRLGAVGTVTGSTFSQKEKGLAIESGNSKYIQYDRQLLPNGSFSLVVWCRIKDSTIQSVDRCPISGKVTDGTQGSINLWFPAALKAMMWMGPTYYRYFDFNFDKKWHCIIFTISGTDINTAQMFSDSIPISVSTTVTGGSSESRTTWSFLGGSNTNTGGVQMSRLKVYDHVLTQQEILLEQVEFNNAQPVNKAKRGFVLNKPTDLSSQVNNTLGNNVVVNGDFTTDTSWTKDASCTISGGMAHFTNSNSNDAIYQSCLLVGRKYLVTYTVSNYISGNIKARLGNTFGITRTANGTYSEIISADVATFFLQTTANNTYLDVDNVSVLLLTGLIAAYNMQKVGNTLVDISGMGNTGTCVKTIATKNGLLFNGVDSVVNITGSSDLSTDTSYSIRFYMSTLRNYNALFQSGIGNYFWVDGGGSLKFTRNNSTFITIGTISAGWNTLTVTVTTSGITNCFINGVRLGSVDMATSSIISTTSWKWGYALNGNFLQGEIADGRIHNRILTLQEIKDYNNSFVQPTLVEDFSDAGADNQASVPREWTKTSGSFKVVENVIKQGELVVNGNFDTDTAWTKSAGVTISGGQLNIAAVNGDIAYQSIIAIGKRYKITYTITVVAGSIRSNFGGTGGNTGLLRTASGTYTEELSSLSTNGNLVFFATSTFTGSVDNVSVTEIAPLQTITNGTKYLEAISEGVIATPSNQAYGSWEFDAYKGADGNTLGINFINSDYKIYPNEINSWWLNLDLNEAIKLWKGNGLTVGFPLASANSYFANNTWYRVKITRTTSGTFTILIKGGAFTPTAGYDGWTLVSTAGGTGTNPVTDNTYTSSNYLVVNLGSGDRIANLTLKNGIKI